MPSSIYGLSLTRFGIPWHFFRADKSTFFHIQRPIPRTIPADLGRIFLVITSKYLLDGRYARGRPIQTKGRAGARVHYSFDPMEIPMEIEGVSRYVRKL